MTRLFALIMLLIPFFGMAAPIGYALDVDQPEVGFVYTLNGSQNRGTMPVQAAHVVIDFDQFGQSSADVTVDVRNARTGLIFAAMALKTKSVLDARNHPTIRFQSTSIRANDLRNLSAGRTINGMLTIRGVTRLVTLDAALFRQQGTAKGDLSRLSFRISGVIKRSDYGASG